MRKFKVTLTSCAKITVEVAAEDACDAKEIASAMWNEGELAENVVDSWIGEIDTNESEVCHD